MPVEKGKYLVYIKEPSLGSYMESHIVYINPIDFWEENGAQADSFTDDQWLELGPTLEEMGLTQIDDGVFECGTFISTEELKDILIAEGFVEDVSFNEFMSESMTAEEDDTVIEDLDGVYNMEDF